MCPLTAIGVWNRRTVGICSSGPPPENNGSPVSPLYAYSRFVPSAPVLHTTGSDDPSVVVTIGAPLPWSSAHHATLMVGGLDALIHSAMRAPGAPGHPKPVAPGVPTLKTT